MMVGLFHRESKEERIGKMIKCMARYIVNMQFSPEKDKLSVLVRRADLDDFIEDCLKEGYMLDIKEHGGMAWVIIPNVGWTDDE